MSSLSGQAARMLCGGQQPHRLVRKNGFDVARCRDCRLIFVANPPDDAWRATHYSFAQGYHTALVEKPEDIARHEAAANCAIVARHKAGPSLLDIGCSSGMFMRRAQAAGLQVQGIEYSGDTSAVARLQHGLAVVSGEIKPDSFARDSFDAARLWDVVEHVPDPLFTLKAAVACLRPGGLMFIKTPNADGWYPRLSLLAAPALGQWEHALPPPHLYPFSLKTLTRLINEAGLEVAAT